MLNEKKILSSLKIIKKFYRNNFKKIFSEPKHKFFYGKAEY
jgi:hypothetical protein